MSTRGHFTIIDNAIIKEEELTIYDKMVYTVLCMFANPKTRSCYPSLETIAKHAGCSSRKAFDVVNKLDEMGYITKITKKTDAKNAHACNLYVIHPIIAEAEEENEQETPENAPKLPDVQSAFPKVEHTDFAPDSYPHESHTYPHEPSAKEQYPLNKTQLNKNPSVRSPYGDYEEILRKLDGHFKYPYFRDQEHLHKPYKAITGYMVEMLTDEYTRIGRFDMPRDQLHRIIFDMNTNDLADFLEYIQRISTKVKPRNPRAYFKTVLIEYQRECHLLYADCV